MKFAVYSHSHGWLSDTCAGGVFSWNVDEAVWWDSRMEAGNALLALAASEIINSDVQILRVK